MTAGSGDPSEAAHRALEVGGRLARGPSERLVMAAFQRELEDQAELFDTMNRVDLAHTVVMIEAGIVPPAAGRALLEALLRLGHRPDDFRPDPSLGDLYTNREAWLFDKTPASGWLGAGRARREATTTAFLMALRSGLLDLAAAIIDAARSLVGRACEHRAALMPDYTYWQAAQPTTFGHYLLGFVYPMLRDLERLQALYRRVNRSSAGCGSSNGSRLPQDRERLGKLLGFADLAVHARDAMWQADLPLETAALLTALLVNQDRLAEDLQIFATAEFGLIELDDGHARASKIMPQKKNPFALTHVRGVANAMIGTLAASAALGRTPSGQPDNRLTLYGLTPRALRDASDAVQLMGEVVGLLRFDTVLAAARLADGSALATDLTETLVLKAGLDFRDAHRLVGFLARDRLTGLTPERLAAAAEHVLGRRIALPEANLRDALDPACAIAARTAPGGAAPEPVEWMLDECRRTLDEAGRWADACRQRLRLADEALTRAVATRTATRPAAEPADYRP